MPTIIQQIEQEEAQVKKSLKDFSPNVTNKQRANCTGSYNYNIDTIPFDKCRLIVYILEYLLGCKTTWLPMEKVHWWSDFSYKGVFCSIAHQKFGFRLYISKELNKINADKLAKKLVAKLAHIIDGLDKVISLYAKKAIKDGKIILHNKLEDLEDRYVYCRDASLKKFDTTSITEEDLFGEDWKKNRGVVDENDEKKRQRFAEVWERYKGYQREANASSYYEEIAVIYFISLIEHICLLLYAFNNDGGSVVELAQKRWGEKFEQVIGISDDSIRQGYEYLKKVSLYRRNPIAHGFLTPKMTEASYYFKQARQRTPINLFNGEVLAEYSYKVDLSKLDKLLSDIRKSPKFHNAMRYLANSQFDISYDDGSIAVFNEINELSEEDLTEFIDDQSRQYDNAVNMDW